jgi:radical SAM protein with 4Fe4S-binding SPASM domain
MNAPALLSELVLEVTNACPHRCLHCSTSGGDALPYELTRAEKLRVVREAFALGLQDLRLLGGEPLIRMQDTLDLLMEANNLGVPRAHICTSATFPQLHWIPLIKGLSPIQVFVDVSIYAADPSIHDEITTTVGSLEMALSSSRKAVEMGLDLSWNFVWMRPNFFELGPVVRLASEIGVRKVRVLRLMFNGRANENRTRLELPQVMLQQCDAFYQSAQSEFRNVELACSKPLNFQLTTARNRTLEPCGACRNQVVVQADGAVIPCIGMKGMPEMELGNVRQDSLKDVWSRAMASPISKLSQKLDECTAAMYQEDRKLVQLEGNLGGI